MTQAPRAEDVITALSGYPTSFAVAGVDKAGWRIQMPRELCVRYVLDGSIRKGADRIHVTARLVDTEIDGLRKARWKSWRVRLIST